MRALKLNATIDSSRRIVLQLPADTPEGEVEIIVLVDEDEKIKQATKGVGRDRHEHRRKDTIKIRRTIGRRLQRPVGVLAPPSVEEIAWREAMSRTRTRVPKGVFRYASIEDANADCERWHADSVVGGNLPDPEFWLNDSEGNSRCRK